MKRLSNIKLLGVCIPFIGMVLSITILQPQHANARHRTSDTKVKSLRFGTIEPPVVAQIDITVEAPTSNQKNDLKSLECSGLAWADGRLIISSDRHDHIVFTSDVDLQKMTFEKPKPLVIIKNEQELLSDAESITVENLSKTMNQIYVLCSLSNDREEIPRPRRRYMARFKIDSNNKLGRTTILNVGKIRDDINENFKKLRVVPYCNYYPNFQGQNKNTYRWGNVEAMTFTADQSKLICGMRNPLYEGNAFIFVLDGFDQAFNEEDPEKIKLLDLFTIDLNGRGVSDICWDNVTKGFLIAAAKSSGPKLDDDRPYPPNSLKSALFWWSGRKNEKPVMFAKMPDVKIEAVCRLGNSRFIAVGSDEADVSENRPEKSQSILTIIDFTGVSG